MSNYFSRKFSGLGYAVQYLKNKNKTNIDDKVQKERDDETEKNNRLARTQAQESTGERVGAIVSTISGPLTLKKSKTLFSALKNKFGSKVDKSENENNLDEEPEPTEPTEPTEPEIDTADIGDFADDEIGPTPMTDAELDQFADPFERTAQNVPGNLNFGDSQTSNLPDELDVGELTETGEPSMNFIQSGLSNAVLGRPAERTQFNPEGTQPAGEQTEAETDDFDVGERLNPETLEPMGESAESKFETVDEAPEDIDDFQSILDMANRTGSFAPEAQIVGGDLDRPFSGISTVESVERYDPDNDPDDDGFQTVDEGDLNLNDFRSGENEGDGFETADEGDLNLNDFRSGQNEDDGFETVDEIDDFRPSNTEGITSGGYDLESFGRSGAQMSGSQFGGDSTIARLNNFEEMTPQDQFAEHSDNVSTFGDGGEDVANVEDVGNVPSTIPELPEGYSNYDVPEVTENFGGIPDVGTNISQTAEGIDEGVGEGVSEISEIAGEATEGLTIASDVLDSAALATDSAAAATAPIPGVDIAVAAVGGLVTAAAIGSSIGLAISGAVQNATKQPAISSSDIPVQQQSLAGKYLGASQSQNYYGDNQ